MKKLWLPALAALLFVGCSTDQTLDTLIPRNALAVVLIDHPAWAAQALGTGGKVPWDTLDSGKPWAGAVVPGSPPAFVLAVALADRPAAWGQIEQWAQAQGGLTASRVGSYALLASPGYSPAALDPDRRFDLARVRAGDPVAVYLDIKNLAGVALPDALRPAQAVLPWAEKNLAGLRLGFAPKDGGLELRLATDWRPGAEAAEPFKTWKTPSDAAVWTGLLGADGVGVAASLPAAAWQAPAALAPDPALGNWWRALAPLLGPRTAFSMAPSGGWGWTLAVETPDPMGVRQALRSLVAGGLLQRNFSAWALDADTPLLYQDRSEADGIHAKVHFGPGEFEIAYGSDRVVLAGGPGAAAALTRWKGASAPAAWASQAPAGASVLATGSFDGLGAKAALKVLGDSNVELRLWVDAAGVKTWEEHLPQALLGWLSGAADSEPKP